MDAISTIIPPLPIFIKSGQGILHKGEKHVARTFHVFDLLFITKGTLYMKENGKDVILKRGDYVILAPHYRHEGTKLCEERTEFFWVHFNFSYYYQLVPSIKKDWSNIIKRKGTYTESDLYELHLPRLGHFHHTDKAIEIFSNLIKVEGINLPEERMKQQSVLYNIIIFIQKNALEVPTSTENVARQCMNYIQKHYRDPGFNVKKMAQLLLYHPDYLTRALKKTIGLTPIQYLNQCRISKAKELLMKENNDLKTIASELGYVDSAYFSRVFKSKEGISPGQYRRITFTQQW
ncbi:helix-turn-helix transcriptional regulator [Salipaludibacillus agaradhaerens]|jgi:AraC-like DNA-binding protein|uniref:Helix-turn-helix transcriptional regulator n=1 Tax=Salipaludibacillus agaradhaerens TaxID=76935 RepID=A0A9Q4AZN2_SALAG|nr:AraC family transcriptional regulator [Salipaludibacillus agaradhaerens]MCR6095728.1 helix-turn-helix transcriptional regulator [Salipaludibacillus agaradhaerens]MCR6114712.1 helix-turn-helix transcriptional regulator [Salipaludibacillus agaradhaerens]